MASTTLSCDKTFRKIQMRLRSSLAINKFLFARSGLIDVDRRENPLIHQPTVQMDLHVARAFEFFENDFIHSATGIDQRRGDNGQTAAIFDVARRAEKLLRFMQRVGIDAAGKNLSARRHDRVIGARQAG